MTDPSLMRLLQLCSGSLPIGGFTYSQGIEWAVECGWVDGENSLRDWLESLIDSALGQLEIPVLARLYAAAEADDADALEYWVDYLLAYRESRELRDEEGQRGRALATLLHKLRIPGVERYRPILQRSQSAGFALVAQRWQIPLTQTAQGFAWAWLEGLVLAGVKLVPLGQSAGQRLLVQLGERASAAAMQGLTLDEAIGASAPALAIASSRHETQYTRLFRS